MTIYTTTEYKGYGNQNYYWYEYRLEGNVIKLRKSKIITGIKKIL